jgi:hypothetical protein
MNYFGIFTQIFQLSNVSPYIFIFLSYDQFLIFQLTILFGCLCLLLRLLQLLTKFFILLSYNKDIFSYKLDAISSLVYNNNSIISALRQEKLILSKKLGSLTVFSNSVYLVYKCSFGCSSYFCMLFDIITKKYDKI